jgi:hypothetical protein
MVRSGGLSADQWRTDRLLRDRTAAAAGSQLFAILVEDGYRQAVAKRPDRVCLGVAGSRSRISPRVLDPINRLSQRGFDQPADFFLFLLVVTALVYVPARLYFGPSRWFELGPFDVSGRRVLLYAAYFFIGAGIGAASVDRGLLGADGRLAERSWGWVTVTLVPHCLLWGLIYIKREILGNPTALPRWFEAAYGLFFVAFSAAEESGEVLDPLHVVTSRLRR